MIGSDFLGLNEFLIIYMTKVIYILCVRIILTNRKEAFRCIIKSGCCQVLKVYKIQGIGDVYFFAYKRAKQWS